MELGIDLGTTNSAVAGYSASGLRIFKTSEGADVLPSAIYIDKRGRRFYGKKAYDQAVLSPENTAHGFKRLMGTSTPFEFAGSGQSLTPEDCSAEVLRQLLAQAYLESGEQQVTGAIVTIPAAFNQMQCEATLRAAHAAGLEKIGLLQEPVAAAMAAMMNTEKKSGQFLVYDLGGGTFDLALVQALNGEISVLDHEGINMLGGRDFDKAIINAIVRPWLLENFDLPDDLQKNPRYRRIIRIAQLAAEIAKIDISTKESQTIHAVDDEIRVQDQSGADIYLDEELTRSDLESLVVERIDETIDLARKVLKKNGYSHDDIDRVAFIGGPTKMPLVRDRVPQQLGIAGDCSVDPMTAVALGAAIFAESRDWSAAASIRKPSRGSAMTGGPLQVTYDYQARTTGEQVVLHVRVQRPVAGHDLEVESDGWTSGRCKLADGLKIGLRLRNLGEQRFRVIVFDPQGQPVPSASAELTIVRTYASASAIPATHSLAVKLLDSDLSEVNTLATFLEKGTSLPAKGRPLQVHAARPLKPDEAAHIAVDIFELERPEIKRPELGRPVGELVIKGSDLRDSAGLRKGDDVIFHWEVDEGCILTASLELPKLNLHFPEMRFFVPLTERPFSGEKGSRLAASVLDEAEGELEEAERIAGDAAGKEIGSLRRRLEEQREQLEQTSDADPERNRSVAEEARRVRCDIEVLLARPEHRGAALSQELTALKSAFNYRARELADAVQRNRFDQLAALAVQEIVRGRPGFETAERQLAEMRAVIQRVLWSDPAFVADVFNSFAKDGSLAIDSAAHQRLVEIGRQALLRGDVDGLRDIVFEMYDNRMNMHASGREAAALATIMR